MKLLETKSGYQLTAPSGGGVLIWRDDAFRCVPARAIRIGDWLRMRLGVDTDAAAPAALPPTQPAGTRAVVYPVPTVVTEAVAEFLGLFVADGTLYRRGFRLKKNEAEVVARFADLCRLLFGATPSIGRDSGGTPLAEVGSVFLARWLSSVDGLAPHAKAVPRVILASPLQYQARFLRGLFEDGTVNVKGGQLDHIDWSNKSIEMVSLVQTMLLRLGIVSSRRCVRKQWHLYIYGAYAKKFGKDIGLISKHKIARLSVPAATAGQMYSIPIPSELALSLKNRRHRNNARARGYLSVALCRDLALPVDFGFHYERVVCVAEVRASRTRRMDGTGAS